MIVSAWQWRDFDGLIHHFVEYGSIHAYPRLLCGREVPMNPTIQHRRHEVPTCLFCIVIVWAR